MINKGAIIVGKKKTKGLLQFSKPCIVKGDIKVVD